MSVPSWAELEARLPDALASLPADSFLIVCADAGTGDERYVQFMQFADRLDAQVVGEQVLPPEQRLTAAGRALMASLGWIAPRPPDGSGNWETSLRWPARSGDYRRVAAMSVAALRDAYEVPTSDALVYRSWNENTRAPVDLPGLGLRRSA